MSFEEEMMIVLKKKLLSEISKTEYTKIDYSNRKPLPKEFLDKLWASINWDEVIERVRPELQRRICNAIVGNMETEIKTDVKSLLSIDGVRQKLRVEAYPKIIEVLEGR